MKHLVLSVLVLLLGASLTACAQPAANPTAGTTPTAATAPAQSEPHFAPGTPEERAQRAVHGLDPRIVIDRIGPAPLPGFREVIATGQVVYISDDGKYMFSGGLVDLSRRANLSEAAMAGMRKTILASLPESDRIVFAPNGPARYTVVVLTDIECGFCRRFHSDIAEYNRLGIRVEYLAFPRAGLGSDDYRKMVAVWCAQNRQAALTDAKNDRPVPAGQCQRTPVDMQYRAGQRMGLEGTPMILTADGRLLGGYAPPEQLLRRLQALQGESAAG